jgi:acyl carrier protein
MSNPVTPTELRTFLQEELSIDAPFTDDDLLFTSGLLDSVAMMNLITFLEEKTGADVRPADVTLDNFDSLTRIATYAATLD